MTSVNEDFRYFFKNVLLVFCTDCHLPADLILSGLPSSILNEQSELVDKFSKAMWFQAHVSAKIWKNFLLGHHLKILDSEENYITTVLYMCQVVSKAFENVHERLLSVVTTVAATAGTFFHDYGSMFYQYTAPIMLTYFERSGLNEEFCKGGGWIELLRFTSALKCTEWHGRRHTKTKEFGDEYGVELEACVNMTPYREKAKCLEISEALNDSFCKQLAQTIVKNYSYVVGPLLLTKEQLISYAIVQGSMENLQLFEQDFSDASKDSGACASTSGIVKEFGVGTSPERAKSGDSVPIPVETQNPEVQGPEVDPQSTSEASDPLAASSLNQADRLDVLSIQKVIHELKCDIQRVTNLLSSYPFYKKNNL